MPGTFEAQSKRMSEERGISGKPLQFGTAVLADRRAGEESQRSISSLIRSASPSLQARHAVYLEY